MRVPAFFIALVVDRGTEAAVEKGEVLANVISEGVTNGDRARSEEAAGEDIINLKPVKNVSVNNDQVFVLERSNIHHYFHLYVNVNQATTTRKMNKRTHTENNEFSEKRKR